MEDTEKVYIFIIGSHGIPWLLFTGESTEVQKEMKAINESGGFQNVSGRAIKVDSLVITDKNSNITLVWRRMGMEKGMTVVFYICLKLSVTFMSSLLLVSFFQRYSI